MILTRTLAAAAAVLALGAGAAAAQTATPAAPGAVSPGDAATTNGSITGLSGGVNTGASVSAPGASVTGGVGADTAITANRPAVTAGAAANAAATARPPADGHDDPAAEALHKGSTPAAGVNTSPVGTSTSSPNR